MEVGRGSRSFQQTPIKHHRIVIANVGIFLLDGKHKLWNWGHIVSYVANQYSRVDFYPSLEINLSLYYGGVLTREAPHILDHTAAALVHWVSVYHRPTVGPDDRPGPMRTLLLS